MTARMIPVAPPKPVGRACSRTYPEGGPHTGMAKALMSDTFMHRPVCAYRLAAKYIPDPTSSTGYRADPSWAQSCNCVLPEYLMAVERQARCG